MKCAHSPLFEGKKSPLLNAVNVLIYAYGVSIYDWRVRLFSSTASLLGSLRDVGTLLGNHFRPEGFQHEVSQV